MRMYITLTGYLTMPIALVLTKFDLDKEDENIVLSDITRKLNTISSIVINYNYGDALDCGIIKAAMNLRKAVISLSTSYDNVYCLGYDPYVNVTSGNYREVEDISSVPKDLLKYYYDLLNIKSRIESGLEVNTWLDNLLED